MDLKGQFQRLASYRSDFASLPSPRPDAPYIYCAAEAGWRARQLTDEQWTGIIRGLRQAFPEHTIVVHGAADRRGSPFDAHGATCTVISNSMVYRTPTSVNTGGGVISCEFWG